MRGFTYEDALAEYPANADRNVPVRAVFHVIATEDGTTMIAWPDYV